METETKPKPETKTTKVEISKENLLTYECFKIEEVGDEFHAHTEGGRFVCAKKSEAIVLKKSGAEKYDRIQVDRTTAEIR